MITSRVVHRSLSISEFMGIEDEDLKRYIFSMGQIGTESVSTHVDNEEKNAYYKFQNTVKMNQQGKHYVSSDLVQWISYNKATKKVKVSSSNSEVFETLLKDYFDQPKMVKKFVRKATATLCKKIMEGKLTTLRDLMKYNASYVIRKKDLSPELVLRYAVHKMDLHLRYIEDPENIGDLARVNIPFGILGVSIFSVKVADIPLLQKKHDEWIEEQNKKYDSLSRRRNDKARNSDVEVSGF